MLFKDIEQRKTIFLTLVTLGIIVMGWMLAHKLHRHIKGIQESVVTEIQEIEKGVTATVRLPEVAVTSGKLKTLKECEEFAKLQKPTAVPFASNGETVRVKPLPIVKGKGVPNPWEMNSYTVFDLVAFVASKTEVGPDLQLCFSRQEGNLFRNLGQIGKGVADGHVNRDGVPFYALNIEFEYSPCDMPASKAPAAKYFGSAMNGMQVLPSTFMDLNGWSITFKKIFSNNQHWYSAEDKVIVQRMLNEHFGRRVVKVDGAIGPKTRRWIAKYLREVFEEHLLPKDLEHCIEDAGFVKTMLTVQGGYEITYTAADDDVAAALGVPGPHNPWDPVISATTSALYLKNLGITKGPRNAACSYFAGPGWKKKSAKIRSDAKDYANKVYRWYPWARQEMVKYYRTNGWKVRT